MPPTSDILGVALIVAGAGVAATASANRSPDIVDGGPTGPGPDTTVTSADCDILLAAVADLDARVAAHLS